MVPFDDRPDHHDDHGDDGDDDDDYDDDYQHISKRPYCVNLRVYMPFVLLTSQQLYSITVHRNHQVHDEAKTILMILND